MNRALFPRSSPSSSSRRTLRRTQTTCRLLRDIGVAVKELTIVWIYIYMYIHPYNMVI